MESRPKVFIDRLIPMDILEYIGQYCDYRIWDSEENLSRAQLLEEVENVEGLLVMGRKIDAELIKRASLLKIVSNISVGYDNFDLEAMKDGGILGTNTPYVLDDTTADLVMGLILAVGRRICEMDRRVKEGKWLKSMGSELLGSEVHHTRLGIIGLGRIGLAIARRARHGFRMEILYHNRERNMTAEEELSAQYRELDDLLQESDYVVAMTPLTPETRGLMGPREFGLMKPSAFFINASRGEIVDEEALLAALNEGKIKGAGLDVYTKEPVDPGHPLLKLPNVVTLPHIGSATAQARLGMVWRAAENLVMGVRGERPPDLVKELQSL